MVEPDARMFMALLLCGPCCSECTQPLSLTTAKVSMPGASFWSQTCNYLCNSNKTAFSSDMDHVHSLHSPKMLAKKAWTIIIPVKMFLLLCYHFYNVNHMLWSLKVPHELSIKQNQTPEEGMLFRIMAF